MSEDPRIERMDKIIEGYDALIASHDREIARINADICAVAWVVRFLVAFVCTMASVLAVSLLKGFLE